MSRRGFHDTDSPGLDSPGGGNGSGMGMSYDMLPPPLPPATSRRMVQPSAGYGPPVTGYSHHGYMSYGDGGSGDPGGGGGYIGGGSGSLHRPCKPGPLTHVPLMGTQQVLPDPNTSPRLLHMRHVVAGDPNHSPLPASPHMRGPQSVPQMGEVPMSPHHPMSPHAINLRLADAAAAAAAAAGQQMHYSDPGQSPHAGHYDLQPPMPSPAAAASGAHFGDSCVSPHLMMHYGGGDHHACSPRGAAPVSMHYGEPVPSPHARGGGGMQSHYVTDGGSNGGAGGGSHYGGPDSAMAQGPGSSGHMTPGGGGSGGYTDGSMHSPHPGPSPVGHPGSAGYHKQVNQQRFFAPNFTMPSDMSAKGDGGGGVCMPAPQQLPSQHVQQAQPPHPSASGSAGSLRYHSPTGSHNDAMLSAINMSADAGAGGGGDVLHDSFVPDAAMESEWGGGSASGSSAAINTGGASYELFTPESEVNDAYKELLPDASFPDASFLGDTDSNHTSGDHELKKKGKGRPCKGTSPGRYGVQCPVCGKTFNNSSALAKHKLTHSEERKYICQLCQKAFKRQDHLNGHMMTHRSKKPYECKIEGCSKSYCDARSLRRHLENHHNVPTDSTFNMPLSGYQSGLDGGGNCMGYYPATPSPHTSPSYSTAGGAASTSSSAQAQYFRFDGGSQAQLSSPLSMSYQHGGGGGSDMHWASTAGSGGGSGASLYGSDPPKPVECSVCRRRFKNLPALNGHMRLHGGYMKKDLSDKEKTDESGGEESSPPPFSQQQQHTAALQQQHPVALQQQQVHERLFRGQLQHGMSDAASSESNLTLMSDAAVNRLAATTVGNYGSVLQQQPQQQSAAAATAGSYQSASANMAWQAATSLISMGMGMPTATSGGGSNPAPVPSVVLTQQHSVATSATETGPTHQAPVQQRAGPVRHGGQDNEGSRIFNFPDGGRQSPHAHFYHNPLPITSAAVSTHAAVLAAQSAEPRGFASQAPGGAEVKPSISSFGGAVAVVATTAEAPGGTSGGVGGSTGEGLGQREPAVKPETAEESSLADRKRHVSADPDKYTSFRQLSFGNTFGSLLLDGLDAEVGRPDVSGHRERRKSAEIPRPKVSNGGGGSGGGFREPYPWPASGTGSGNAGGGRGAEGELFTRSDSAVIFRNPSGLPAKGKRNRPEPLVIVHTASFQSRLRSPRTWEQPDVNACRVGSGAHKSPPPYTPPPILSPVRSGSGLFWSMSGTYRPVTPHSAAPVTPKALPQRQSSSSSSNSSAATVQGISHDTIDEVEEEEEDDDEDEEQAQHNSFQAAMEQQQPTALCTDAFVVSMVNDRDSIDIDTATVSAEPLDKKIIDGGGDTADSVPGTPFLLASDGVIRPHVNIGPNYQAEVPEYVSVRDDACMVADLAGLLWDPSVLPADVTDADLQCFQEFACCAAIPGNGCNKEYAMHLLLLRDGSIPDALLDLMNSNIVLPKDHILASYKYQESEAWSREEIETFTCAILKCDKDFYSIAKEMNSKDVRQCVEFYYLWKKVCPDEYKRLRFVRRRRESDAMYNLRSRGGGVTSGTAVLLAKDGKDIGDEGAEDDDAAAADAGSDAYEDTDASQSDSDSSDGTETPSNNYACDRSGCCASFASKAELMSHTYEAHTPDPAAGLSPHAQARLTPSRHAVESSIAVTAEEFPCKLCGKVFSKVKSRSAHMKSHRQQGEKAASPALYGHSSKKPTS